MKPEDPLANMSGSRPVIKGKTGWGWGWAVLLTINNLDFLSVFNSNRSIFGVASAISFQLAGIPLLLIYYFWLRKWMIRKIELSGQKWIASLIAGIISTIITGFILSLYYMLLIRSLF
jgi:VIT1/CCC1 family predicted Fe2+/Mn2+ transporter